MEVKSASDLVQVFRETSAWIDRRVFKLDGRASSYIRVAILVLFLIDEPLISEELAFFIEIFEHAFVLIVEHNFFVVGSDGRLGYFLEQISNVGWNEQFFTNFGYLAFGCTFLELPIFEGRKIIQIAGRQVRIPIRISILVAFTVMATGAHGHAGVFPLDAQTSAFVFPLSLQSFQGLLGGAAGWDSIMFVFNVSVKGRVTEVLFAAPTVVDSPIFIFFASSSLVFLHEVAHFPLHLNIE